MWSKIWKWAVTIAGIIGVAAQAKARGASNAQAAFEAVTAIGATVGTLHMTAPAYGAAQGNVMSGDEK